MIITRDWSTNRTWSGATHTVKDIDDQLRDMSLDIEERLKNGGHLFNASSRSLDGVHAVTADNYVANEWAVYDDAALTTKALRVTASAIELNHDTTVTGDQTVTGSLTVNSKTPLYQTDKQLIVLSVSGNADAGGGSRIKKTPILLPTHYIRNSTATLVEAWFGAANSPGTTVYFSLKHASSAITTDKANADPTSGTTLASSNINSTYRQARLTSFGTSTFDMTSLHAFVFDDTYNASFTGRLWGCLVFEVQL